MLEGRAMTGVDAGRHRGAHARTGSGPGGRAGVVPGHGGEADASCGPGAPAAAGRPGAAAGHSLAARLLVPLAPGVLGLITGIYHLGVPPLWRDEAATKAIASRPVGQILATMPHDDVVHGAYYLVVHVFIQLFGSSDGALRLPSAIAAAVACAVTALVAQRLAAGGGRATGPSGPSGPGGGAALAGVTAGAVLALLPAMIRYAQEARSYAIVTMLAAIATYLLLRAVDGGRPRWWAAYGAAVFLTGLFNIFGLLIVVAHGLTLLATGWGAPGGQDGRRGRGPAQAGGSAADPGAGTAAAGTAATGWAATGTAAAGTTAAGYYGADFASPTAPKPRGRRLLGVPLGWLAAGLVAVALLAPLVIMAYAQRNALSWMTASAAVGRDTVALAHLWAGSPGLVWPVFGLAALGVVVSLIAGPRSLSPATVALPWLVAPPAILLAVSATHPVYDQRYVEFCLPALAICVAAGITGLWRLAAIALGRLARGGSASDGSDSGRSASGQGTPARGAVALLAWLPAVAAAVALAVALQPADAVVRQPSYRPDDLEHEAQIIAANYQRGDIVFFIPVNDRIVSMPFPGPWQKLRDIGLADSPVSSDTLYGTDVSPAELLKRDTHVTRVWVVSSSEVPEATYLASAQATPLDREEFALVGAMRQLHRWRDGDTELTLYATR
jgi:mannosyltransferase